MIERSWTAEAVFATEADRAAYYLDLDNLWRWRIVEANVNLRISAEVRRTPLNFLLGPSPQRHLLARMGENALRLGALDTINALMDGSKGALTVHFLKERLVGLARPELREALEQGLDDEFARQDFTQLQQRARWLRHKLLAHADARELRGKRRTALMTRQEIQSLLDHAKSLISALSLDRQRSFDFPPTLHPYGMSELITDVVRTHSHVLRQPETEHPMVFKAIWQQYTLEERQTFHEWRARVGLPKVDPPRL